MISLIMPYWNRQTVLDANLARMKLLYPKYDMEVIIVNDGWHGNYILKEIYPWPVRVYQMPPKETAKNPCVPINKGVNIAKGNIIILTNPEVVQRQPIIDELKVKLTNLGSKGYVAAATWDVDRSHWFCHSTYRTPTTVPRNAGLHFFAMMYKEFFQQVKFDEGYREGQAFEDNDFLWRLWEAEAKFEICDDLPVNHYKTETQWPKGGHALNSEIFRKKWLPITPLASRG